MRRGDNLFWFELRLFTFFALVLMAQTDQACAFASKRAEGRPCPHILILHPEKINLSDAELRLICGDPDMERVGLAWRNIPPAQAQSNFKNFLQDRGYFSPRFTSVEGGNAIEFDPGPLSRLLAVSSPNLPPAIPAGSYRIGIGEPLTPKRISQVTAWAKRRLQEEGYPCPAIEARAYPETGRIILTWKNPSEKGRIKGVLTDPRSQSIPRVIRRYDAFELNGPYSLILTEISSRRSTDERLVSSHDFTPECPGDQFLSPPSQINIIESAQTGPPRMVSLGLSVNSEVGPQAHASWSHTRLGVSGSFAEVTARASLKEQLGRGKMNWYYLKSPTRQHLSPLIEFSHQNERRYELLALRSHALWETGGEFSMGSWTIGIGPSWQNLQQIQGIGPLHSEFFATKLELGYLSHFFEYFRSSPRYGQQVALSMLAVPRSLPGAGRPLAVSLQQTWLFSPQSTDPPWVIFGIRGKAFSTFIPTETRSQDLPIDFRHWIGGGQDLRGFGREELPDQDFGARQGLAVGTEIRTPHLLPYKLEPLLLADGAWLRSGAIASDESTQGFWDAGFGIRWESPVGTLRTTLAHGFEIGKEDSNLSHWQVYLSLGEEF